MIAHHVVVPGDTLSGIARQHGSTVEAIARANSWIEDINLVLPGWVFHVPVDVAPDPDPDPVPNEEPAPDPDPDPVPVPSPAGDGIWIDPDELAALPMSGPAWEHLESVAIGSWGSANVSDQDSNHDVATFAGGLYAARTGNAVVRASVIAAVNDAIGTEAGGRTLALARNLTGYVLAADLIGYRDDRFVQWVDDVRHRTLDGKTLISTHEDRPNNWGTHAGAARIAAAMYLGDVDDLGRAAAVFLGWLGESYAYDGFKYGSLAWQSDPANPVGINPAHAEIDGHDVDGALPEELRRSGGFSWPPPKQNYCWEAMQGAVTQALLLERAGFHDVWDWADRALLRAASWLYDVAAFPAEGDDRFVPHLIDHAYGTDYASGSAGAGKSVGFTDWTHAV